MEKKSSQGFALVITLIFVSVVLALGVSLLDVAYKQILLSSSSKQSQYAFYNADSAMECALYYDQKSGVFGYDYVGAFAPTCGGQSVTISRRDAPSVGSNRTTIYDVNCVGGGVSATVTAIKQSNGATNIFANGYNTCNASLPNRIERGLKVSY
ncbi:MAG: hypothetical protein ABIT47_00150 [Candidatus Paceibacterota bacterium]